MESMKRKNYLTLGMAAVLSLSLIGNTAVFADDVLFGDSPEQGGYGEDYVEQYNPDDPDGSQETNAPETSAPETNAPETNPPETNPPETNPQQADPYYPPQDYTEPQWSEPQWSEPDYGYEESYGDTYYEDTVEPEVYGGYEGDASTLGPDRVMDDFEIYSREDAERDFNLSADIPRSFYLDVKEELQEPELPTGCEATALSMALQYEGFDVDKVEIAEEYLLYNRENDNLAEGFIGDPFASNGAGCFSPAITATADYYFEVKGEDYRAYDISGTEMEKLYAYVAAGTPVMVWTTMYMQQPTFQDEVSEYKGRICRWYSEEHCVVLTGYDLDAGTVRVNDPLDGIVDRDMEEFAAIYEMTGESAVVLKAQGENKEKTQIAAEKTTEKTTEDVSASGLGVG